MNFSNVTHSLIHSYNVNNEIRIIICTFWIGWFPYISTLRTPYGCYLLNDNHFISFFLRYLYDNCIWFPLANIYQVYWFSRYIILKAMNGDYLYLRNHFTGFMHSLLPNTRSLHRLYLSWQTLDCVDWVRYYKIYELLRITIVTHFVQN